jgi:uncharacterized membrane protein
VERIAFKDLRLEADRFEGLARWTRRSLLVLFILQTLFIGANLWSPFPRLANARWPDGLLVVLATATTLASLGNQLPGQNVIGISIIITVMSGGMATLSGLMGIPFGPCSYTANIGQLLFYPLPWAIPALWLVAILSSRGVARLILRPSRTARTYGYQLIGVTIALTVLFDLGLEPYATSVKQFWTWHKTKLPFDWYGAPIVNFFGWAVTSLLILAFVTPFLLVKKPVKHPPDFQPLVVWSALSCLFLAGAFRHSLWPAVSVLTVQTLLVTALAVLGGTAKRGD